MRSPRPSARPSRYSIGVGAALLVAGLTACADLATAPGAAPRPGAPAFGKGSTTGGTTTTTTTSGTAVTGLLWTKDVSQTTSSRVIGPDGGSVSISNGIKVIVPRGAVATNVAFSVTRLAGRIVAYDFQPHGIRFAVPVQIEQPTLGTSLKDQPTVSGIEGAYFPEASSLDQAAGTATVTEFRPTFVSADNAWVKFTVDHFSGYMLSSGRTR
jgi:hypothetical protein